MTKTLDWDIEKLIRKFDPRISQKNSPVEYRQRDINDNVTYSDLNKAYHLAAVVVSEHGEEYLPIFERLQKELQDYDQRTQLLEEAKGKHTRGRVSSMLCSSTGPRRRPGRW